jgi:hypothetical protein
MIETAAYMATDIKNLILNMEQKKISHRCVNDCIHEMDIKVQLSDTDNFYTIFV